MKRAYTSSMAYDYMRSYDGINLGAVASAIESIDGPVHRAGRLRRRRRQSRNVRSPLFGILGRF